MESRPSLSLTSRERVLLSLNHRNPGKIAVDFSGHRSSGIAAMAYARLRDYLSLPKKPVRVYDMVQQLAVVDDDVLDLFRVDTVELGRAFLTEETDWKEWRLPDGTPCLIPSYVNVKKHQGGGWSVYTDDGQELGIQKDGCLYFEQNYFPLMHRSISEDDFSDLERMVNRTIWTGVTHPGAHFSLDEEGAVLLTEGARKLRTSTDRAVIGLFGGNMFEIPQMLYRMDNYLTYLVLFPEDVLRLSEKLCEIHLKHLERWLKAVGPYIDIILFGDDLGGQKGPLISPDLYRRLYKPFHKQLWKRTKELSGVKIMLHSCGGIRPLLPDLIEAGLDAVNPVQFRCRGMDVEELKKEFGGMLTFWGGGCDTQIILPQGSPGSVRDHVKRQCDILSRDGGFVFQQVHNIQADVPPENIKAMFDAVHSL